MTPTITMQMSLLRPIPIDRRLYIKVKLLGTDGTKIDVSATAWARACGSSGVHCHGHLLRLQPLPGELRSDRL